MNIEGELLSAWANLSPPSRSAVTEHDCAECAEISDFFGGKQWTELTDVGALRYHHEALHLFAPRAFHYYLPAFVRAAVRDEQPDIIGSAIVSAIRQELGSASRGRLELFSSEQRAVLARFLRVSPKESLANDDEVAALAELLEA